MEIHGMGHLPFVHAVTLPLQLVCAPACFLKYSSVSFHSQPYSWNLTLSRQRDTRPGYRLLVAGGVNVNRRTSGTPHSVALPATKRRYPGSEGVLRLRFVILQGTGTKRTGRTLSDSNAAEAQIYGSKPYVPLSTEGKQS